MNASIKKLFSCLLCIWFSISSTLGSVANAQALDTDFEAPIIEHEEVVSGTLGDVEVFIATVVDNGEVDSVSLFYRYAGDEEFIEIAMQELVQSSSYSAKIDTASRTADDEAIEYYIRAEDGAGNVVLKGLSFDPLVRTLINPDASSATATIAGESTPAAESVAPKKKINWLYVGLGALLVGGIAASAGGGGGSDGDGAGGIDTPQPGCDPSCTITLTLNPP
ncbi:MAG: hypothetical protein AB8B97_11870 [Granulosicoccus sp.]